MDTITPELEGISLVVVGNFNPAIFHPLWFAAHDVLSVDEANEAEVQLMSDELVIFNTEWFQWRAFAQRIMIDVSDLSRVREAVDLLTNTFNLLGHTPIKAFGLNRNCHVRLESFESLDHLLQTAAPPGLWSDVIKGPRPSSVTVESEVEKTDSLQSRLEVQLERSKRVLPGLFAEINRHYQVRSARDDEQMIGGDGDEADDTPWRLPEGAATMIETLPGGCDSFLRDSGQIIQHIHQQSRANRTE